MSSGMSKDEYVAKLQAIEEENKTKSEEEPYVPSTPEKKPLIFHDFDFINPFTNMP